MKLPVPDKSYTTNIFLHKVQTVSILTTFISWIRGREILKCSQTGQQGELTGA